MCLVESYQKYSSLFRYLHAAQTHGNLKTCWFVWTSLVFTCLVIDIACSSFTSVYCKCYRITCLKTQLLWSQPSRSNDEYDVIWDRKCQRKKDNISSVAPSQVNFPCGDQDKQHQPEEWDLIWPVRQTEKTGKWWTRVERNWKWKRWSDEEKDSARQCGESWLSSCFS